MGYPAAMADRLRGGLKSRLTWLAGLSPLLCATPAAAEPFQTGGVGVFAGYAFGERGGFEWGLEGFATRYLEYHQTCEGSLPERHGVGPLLRLSAVKLSRLELTLAAHGGGDLPNLRVFGAVDGELGASLFFERGHDLAVAPHSALLAEYAGGVVLGAAIRRRAGAAGGAALPATPPVAATARARPPGA